MFTIDWNTGMTEYVTGALSDARRIADDGAGYTQTDIVIYDDVWNELTRRRWYGMPYDPAVTEDAEDEIISFGDFGYFGAWG